jgi:hypothetical protein
MDRESVSPAKTAVSSASSQLIDTVACLNALRHIPAPVPTIFSGEPLEFMDWKFAFQTLIQNKGIPSADRIFYLKQYVSGRAKESISGHFYDHTEAGFENAMATLERRFGDPLVISEAFRKKLGRWTRIKEMSGDQVMRLADYTNHISACMETMPGLEVMNDSHEVKKLIELLPRPMVTRWNRFAHDYRQRNGKYPGFKNAAEFISSEAELLVDPYSVSLNEKTGGPDKRLDYKGNQRTQKVLTARTQADVPNEVKRDSCSYCGKGHSLPTCFKFRDQCTYEKKLEFIKEKGLCFGCLVATHRSKFCQQREKCKDCGKAHPTILHRNNFALSKDSPQDKTKDDNSGAGPAGLSQSASAQQSQHAQQTVNTHATSSDDVFEMSSMIVPVWITSNSNQDKRLLVYALLDSQSDTTFITEQAASILKADGVPTTLRIKTVTDSEGKITHCKRYDGLTITAYSQPTASSVALPTCFSKQNIPVNLHHIPSPEKANSHPHLRRIACEIPEPLDIEVGLLIGYDCANALRPVEIISGEENGPYAVKTVLGWTVVGSTQRPAEGCTSSHRIMVKHIHVPSSDMTMKQKVNYVQRTTCKEISPLDALRCIERDFVELGDEVMMSQEDYRFLDLLRDKTFQQLDGHYNMPLPFKAPPQLRNNRNMALRRFSQTQKRFRTHHVYHEKYKEFMSSMIERGEAEPIQNDQKHKADAWYIPHHGVFHPQKPDKLRVVFDCSASDGTNSLNSCLMSGPDLNNQLLGVLLRFRLNQVAIMCDIQRMYHQFRVAESDRDYLRFLWCDSQGDPLDYRMTVHLFGATSSPNCAKFGLRTIASDHGGSSPRAQQFILRDFYVDDGLTSVNSESEAKDLLRKTQTICAKGNLKLHKIISNRIKVLEAVAPEDRLLDTSVVELKDDILPMERALGVQWNINQDEFTFKVREQQKPLTKRGLLSTVSAVYDPLGLIAPVVLEGKLLLQAICKSSNWDDPIPEQMMPLWEKWLKSLSSLPGIAVPRCLKPMDFGRIVKTELHHFADASTKGYCAVSYIRLINDCNQISCRMLMGKSRVAPSKVQTIPRLELQAAVLATETARLLKKELNIQAEEHLWTDSSIVLSYIQSEAKRFKTYVSNRVQKINSNSSNSSWHHVESTKNPADIGSRGVSPNELMNSIWFRGPDFLHQAEPYVSPIHITGTLMKDDPEVCKAVNTLATKSSDEATVLNKLEKFSDWNRMLGGISLLVTAIRRKTGQPILTPAQTRKLTEARILKMLQAKHYGDKTKLSQRGHHLASLSPFVSDDGLLRVGGRLANSTTLHYGVKHPIILPKYSHVTELIIRHIHDMIHHQGRSMTVNALRSNGFWVVGCSEAVSSVIRKCVVCKRHRILDPVQKMADLPKPRVEPAPPFLFAGIDCFGPFYAKDGRKESKRYGLIVTCLASRAVHLELLEDMSTDSLINALRNTMAIRGYIQEIRCDNGSNFVGAHNELSRELRQLELSRVKSHFLRNKTDFVFNPPHASNFGGVWERLILSTRRILDVVLGRSHGRLSTASLRTVLYEVMSILNSRPLAPTGPNDLEALTPNHLHTGKSFIMTDPGDFEADDLYSRKQWKRVQTIANEFWRRWETEYLNTLQSRKKWTQPQRNLSVGDVVVLKDVGMPRNHWRLAIVVNATASADLLVRKVTIKLSDGSELERPSSEVILLVACGGS